MSYHKRYFTHPGFKQIHKGLALSKMVGGGWDGGNSLLEQFFSTLSTCKILTSSGIVFVFYAVHELFQVYLHSVFYF